jgi:hypothetical protein
MTRKIVFRRGEYDNSPIEAFGFSFRKEGDTAFADSVAAVQAANQQIAPTYLIAEALAIAEKGDQIWSKGSFATNAEVDIMLDSEGILGEVGKQYVVDFQRGGIFVNDHERIRRVVVGMRNIPRNDTILIDESMPLDQEEVNEFLTYVKERDCSALEEKGWLQGKGLSYIFRDLGEFIDASDEDSFLTQLPAYVVITPAEFKYGADNKVLSSMPDHSPSFGEYFESYIKKITDRRENPHLLIRSGGRAALKKNLERAEAEGIEHFFSTPYSMRQNHNNRGRIVCFNTGYYTGFHTRGIFDDSSYVSIDPDMFEHFNEMNSTK